MLGTGKKSIVPFFAMFITVMMLSIPKLYAVNPKMLQNFIKIGQLALEIFVLVSMDVYAIMNNNDANSDQAFGLGELKRPKLLQFDSYAK